MHMHQRTWFPFILIGVTVGFIVFVATLWEPSIPKVTELQVVPPKELPEVTAPSASQYQSEIRKLVNVFMSSKDVEQAYDSLLGMRVPAEFKDFHFDLAVALGEFRLGNDAKGQVKIDFLKKDSPWLNQ